MINKYDIYVSKGYGRDLYAFVKKVTRKNVTFQIFRSPDPQVPDKLEDTCYCFRINDFLNLFEKYSTDNVISS
ncbi:MAG: hypothetical protein Q4B67_08530 [Eubacteriales bacterium]|nr:hypothetical protein [Eubacteriales bacterium]